MNLFSQLMEMTLSAGLLILFILILRKAAQIKLPKTMFLVLWDIVIIRLLLPFSIPAKISWFSIFDSFLMKEKPQAAVKLDFNSITKFKTDPAVSVDNILEIALFIWIIGAVLCISYFLFHCYKSYKKIRESLPLKKTDTINHILEKLPLKRNIIFQVSDQIMTPITYGLFKPRIVLPTFISSDNTIQLKHIITHEYIHIRRFDCIQKWLSVLTVCLHWFNPFVWLMYYRFNDDLEIICDTHVIKLLGEKEKENYAGSLIQLAQQQSHFFTPYQGFGKSAVKERIVFIMKYKKTTAFGISCAALLFIASTTVFASTSNYGEKKPSLAETEKTSSISTEAHKSAVLEKKEDKETDSSELELTYVYSDVDSSTVKYPITIETKDDSINAEITEKSNDKPTSFILSETPALKEKNESQDKSTSNINDSTSFIEKETRSGKTLAE